MTALAKSASGISASLDLEDVFGGILEQTQLALSVEVVALTLVDVQSGALGLRAFRKEGDCQLIESPRVIDRGISCWVVKHNESVVISDVTKDPRFDSAADQFAGIPTRSILCAPIHLDGNAIGTLEAINPTSEFEQDAPLILSGIANLSGTAIQNAQLYAQLHAAHQSYQELFEDSIDPILITDWDGQILEANRKAALFSDCTQEALRSISIDQVHQIDHESVGECFTKLRSGITIAYESRLRTSGGHEVPVMVYVREIHVDNSSRLQWILRDITEQKKLDTLRDDLTSMIYHDLRSPLANVVSSLDLLDSMLPSDDPAMKSLLEISMRSTERIQRMTDSLLDLSVLQAGQPIGTRKPTNILALVYEAVQAMESLVHNKSQIISYKVSERLPNVEVDQDMIRRVVTNLLENASKYSPQGSKIEVGAGQEGDQILVWVGDKGPGIPASEYERIFEKFTRLKTENAPKGLGLGLAYCRLAVQAHGGKIWVESEVGVGSCFRFTLPV
jgi:PAS domain S-box-containing protein